MKAEQYAVMRGKSGADHTFDVLATRDDGLTVPPYCDCIE